MPQTKLGKWTVHYRNEEEFHHLKREVFTKDSYYVEFERPDPVIIDAGAHIGLSTLYFKMLAPEARITAIEPHPVSYPLLEQNMWENNLNDVITLRAALVGKEWPPLLEPKSLDEEPKVQLNSDVEFHWFSSAGFFPGAWTGEQHTEIIKVPALKLSEILEAHELVDLIKMDIEGAEQAVLFEAKPFLKRVKKMIIEWHPRPEQSLETISNFLSEQGFELQYLHRGRSIPLEQALEKLLLLHATRV